MLTHSCLGVRKIFRKVGALCLLFMALIGGFSTGAEPDGGPGNDERAPVPDPASQEKAEKLIKDLLQDEYTKKASPDKLALAAKSLEQAKETRDDPAARFVLMREARDLAAQAGDPVEALKAVEIIAKEYIVNGLAMKTAALEVVEKGARSRTRNKALIDAILPVVDEALAADDFDLAAKLLELAGSAARRTKNVAVVTTILARSKQVESLRKEHEQVWPAAIALTKNPKDPEANLAMGKYLCFIKGDWEKGLPMLALGNKAKLKGIAENDLSSPEKGTDLAALGDAWWDLGQAEKGQGKALMKSRA